jgi:hypothetical protein
MWEVIQEMAGDRLWIYTGIGGTVAGAIFLAWFKDTRFGIWMFHKFDEVLEKMAAKFGWIQLQEPEDAWRQKYPKITKKIDELEAKINELAKK